MAERRMFAKTIITSDAFLDMPATARCLYFLLGMVADDDGFVNAPRAVMRQAGASLDDMNLLIAKRFVLTFESGVIVIKHWKIHNLIQKDRYKETKYLEEKSQLTLDKNNAYTVIEEPTETLCIHSVSNVEPQVRLGKISVGKDRLGKDNVEEAEEITFGNKKRVSSAATRHEYGAYRWVKLTDEEYNRLLADLGERELTRCIAYIDESAQSTGNKNRWKDWNLVIRKCHRENWGVSAKGAETKPRENDALIERYCQDAPAPMNAKTELDNLKAYLGKLKSGDNG